MSRLLIQAYTTHCVCPFMGKSRVLVDVHDVEVLTTVIFEHIVQEFALKRSRVYGIIINIYTFFRTEFFLKGKPDRCSCSFRDVHEKYNGIYFGGLRQH